jgi:hypothetical protein
MEEGMNEWEDKEEKRRVKKDEINNNTYKYM